MRFPTLLFDFDGTLVDSIELILESYRHTLRVHRGTIPDDSVWLEGLGTPLRVQFRTFTEDPAEIEAMIATYREWNYAHHDAMVRPYPGAVQTVRALKEKGARLAIVSSKHRRGILRGMEVCGFGGLFDCLVTSDSIEASKPDPAPVLAALAELKAEPAQALVVGDSPHDIAAGRDAGTKTAACLWGPFDKERLARENPDYWLASFSELEKLATG